MEQIKAAVAAVRNTRGLPLEETDLNLEAFDLLAWLQHWFGFQVIHHSFSFSLFRFFSGISFSYIGYGIN